VRGLKTGGRARGVPNRLTKEVRDMVVEALHNAGGVAYLERQALENPTAFLSLVARMTPRESLEPGVTGTPPNLGPHARVVVHIPHNERRIYDVLPPASDVVLLPNRKTS